MKEKLYIENKVWEKENNEELLNISLDDVKWCFLEDGTYMMSNGNVLLITVDDMGNYYLYDTEEDGAYINQEYYRTGEL